MKKSEMSQHHIEPTMKLKQSDHGVTKDPNTQGVRSVTGIIALMRAYFRRLRQLSNAALLRIVFFFFAFGNVWAMWFVSMMINGNMLVFQLYCWSIAVVVVFVPFFIDYIARDK